MLRLLSIPLLLLSSASAFAQAKKPVKQTPPTPQQLIQGIWAESEEENALYWVRGNKLYYTDFLDTPVRYTLTSTTFTVYNDGVPFANRLLKLTKDSLVYVSEDGYVSRLYKRRK